MEETKTIINRSSIIPSSVIAYAVAALFNAILVVIKETNPSIMTWLKVTFTHHWIGQGILVITVFVVVLLITMFTYKTQLTEDLIRKLEYIALISTLLSIIIIAGFYATEAL